MTDSQIAPLPRMTYDDRADVLYITLHDEPAHHAIDDSAFVLRYREDGTFIGITILDLAALLEWGSLASWVIR